MNTTKHQNDTAFAATESPAQKPAADEVNHQAENNQEASDHIEEIYNVLGRNVVLLPIPTGTKAPTMKGWQTIFVEETRNPEYLAQLRAGNIGVLLGDPSGGLCAIDIDADERVEPFLALNPLLRNTLITKGARGAQIWVRIDGEFPGSTKLKNADGTAAGEWRANGNQSVIYGIHPDGMNYRRLNNAKPTSLRFEEIKWPDDMVLPWAKGAYEEVVSEHGRPFNLTQKGVLQLNDYFFVDRYKREHLVLWEPLEEEFYQYNSVTGLWEIVTEDAITWQFGLDFKRAGDEVSLEQFIWKRKKGMLTSMVGMLRGLVGRKDAFKKRQPVIHLANGMLDLSSTPPRLMSFHPDYYSRNLCPLPFNPEAECPRFINELLRTALEDADIDLLQMWAGSVLLGNNTAQRILLLIGTPAGGKSTLIEVIEKVIGEQNVAQLRTKHLQKQFEFYKFLGKTLLTGKDVGASFLSEEGAENLKALVGNDLLDAEKKHGNEQFQLRGNFSMAITCNSKLKVKLEGDTGAWERRLMIINYSKPKPKERITEFADKLIKAEGPGILNWMIEGAIRYIAETEKHGDFQLTPAQKERVSILLSESDSVRQFVQDRVQHENKSTLTVFEMQQAYFEYCEEMGWHAFSTQDFKSSVPDLMLEIHHVGKSNDLSRGGGTQRGFRNVSIVGGLK